MSGVGGNRGRPPLRVPTLTEVVEVPWRRVVPEFHQPEAEVVLDSEVPAPQTLEHPGGLCGATAPTQAAAISAPLNEEQIVQHVLRDLQRQIDLMLDYRLREILTPMLTRATDGLVLEARGALASTLHDIVARSVALELARHRGR